MSSHIVTQTLSIMEGTLSVPYPSKKFRMDVPQNSAESEKLELLKKELQGYVRDGEADDDYFYLRFLRARSWNVPKAKEMLINYLDYKRTDENLRKAMMRSYVTPQFIIDQVFLTNLGFDRNGRPVYILKVGSVNLKAMFERGLKDDLCVFGSYCLEWVYAVTEKCRKASGCTKLTALVDAEGLSFSSAFHVQTIQLGMKYARIFESCYPELLQTLIAFNTNWISYSLYNVMKPFLSAETLEKVQVYGSDRNTWKPALQKYLHDDIIPSEYGGDGPSIHTGLCLRPFRHFTLM